MSHLLISTCSRWQFARTPSTQVASIEGQLFHRKDIGTSALVRSRVAHMLSLQASAPRGTPSVCVGVLGSTRGSSLQPVLQAIASGALPGVHVGVVISNKQDAPILERAREHGLNAEHVAVGGRGREAYDAELTSRRALADIRTDRLTCAARIDRAHDVRAVRRLEAAGVQCVLLVGWMRILSADFVKRWERRSINVHPSLLPDFAGGMDLDVRSRRDLGTRARRTSRRYPPPHARTGPPRRARRRREGVRVHRPLCE